MLLSGTYEQHSSHHSMLVIIAYELSHPGYQHFGYHPTSFFFSEALTGCGDVLLEAKYCLPSFFSSFFSFHFFLSNFARRLMRKQGLANGEPWKADGGR